MKHLILTLFIIFNFISKDAKASTIYPSSVTEYASTVVMIMNKGETGGGTGVIWHSTKERSFILTNKHICEVTAHGGEAIKDEHKYPVAAQKESSEHDLCLISIESDLNINTEIAENPPHIYSKATIAGFPHLLPETVVTGHFSKRHEITVQTGSRPCDLKEFKENPMGCVTEGFPILQDYDAQLVTATILPGNSGSPVFNDDGEIAGLVFASDSRELSYAEIVPQEYVKNFVTKEINTLKWIIPVPEKIDPICPLRPNRQHFYVQPIYKLEQQ